MAGPGGLCDRPRRRDGPERIRKALEWAFDRMECLYGEQYGSPK